MTRVLVTGATGTVGSRVLAQLRERDVPVRAFARGLGGDFDDAATIRAALDGVTAVFLAAPNGPRQLAHETAVIDAAVAAGVQRIVKLSAIGAEVGSPVPFWDCHGRVEADLRACGVSAAILRSSFFMTNIDVAAPELYLPGAGARVAMIDPDDVAAAAAAARCDGATGTHELTGPASLTFDEVADVLSEVTGRAVGFVPVPDEAAREAMVAQGLPAPAAAGIVSVFAQLRAGAHERVTGEVRALVGREPRSFLDHARSRVPQETPHV
jgi:uncharacterized protein YbjT (DUF2867 family)